MLHSEPELGSIVARPPYFKPSQSHACRHLHEPTEVLPLNKDGKPATEATSHFRLKKKRPQGALFRSPIHAAQISRITGMIKGRRLVLF
jgi:hypothetical protein